MLTDNRHSDFDGRGRDPSPLLPLFRVRRPELRLGPVGIHRGRRGSVHCRLLWVLRGCAREPLHGCDGKAIERNGDFVFSKLLLFQFSIFLVLILALELGAGITAYMRRNEVKTMLEGRMNSTMHDYYSKPEIKNSWDIMQHEVGVLTMIHGQRICLVAEMISTGFGL